MANKPAIEKKATEEKAPAAKKSATKKVAPKKAELNKNFVGFEYRIVRAPHVTEKAAHSEEHKTYVFEVGQLATKNQITVAIEHLFGVRVLAVRTLRVKSKPKRRGVSVGKTTSWKKAYVTIHKEDTISLS